MQLRYSLIGLLSMYTYVLVYKVDTYGYSTVHNTQSYPLHYSTLREKFKSVSPQIHFYTMYLGAISDSDAGIRYSLWQHFIDENVACTAELFKVKMMEYLLVHARKGCVQYRTSGSEIIWRSSNPS